MKSWVRERLTSFKKARWRRQVRGEHTKNHESEDTEEATIAQLGKGRGESCFIEFVGRNS